MPVGPARMPLFDHLGELRMRLVRIIACLAIAVVVFYMATPIISQFLLQPISPYLPEGTDGLLAGTIVLDPFEAFATRFKISIWTSVVACSPVILWQILAFFLPALKPSGTVFVCRDGRELVYIRMIFCYRYSRSRVSVADGSGCRSGGGVDFSRHDHRARAGSALRSAIIALPSSSTSSRTRSCAAAGARCTSCSWSSRLWPRRTLRRSPCCSCSRRCWCCTKAACSSPASSCETASRSRTRSLTRKRRRNALPSSASRRPRNRSSLILMMKARRDRRAFLLLLGVIRAVDASIPSRE